MLRADLHVHTLYSGDSRSTPQQIVARCSQVGINCLAVTDHNAIAGALEVKRIAPFPIIVGEEILTSSGEIIGLFLEELVPKGLSLEETIARIKAQGGLAGIPHPYDRIRVRSTLRRRAWERVLGLVDFIEVFNSRTTLLRDSERARQLAETSGLLQTAGSDAHSPGEIGAAYVEMAEFNDVEGFRSALARGRVLGRRSSPLVHFHSLQSRVARFLGRRQ